MAVFVRRLLGIGKLPEDLHAQVEAEGLLYLADYVAVTRRFSGVIPGVRLPHSVAYYTGSLVLTTTTGAGHAVDAAEAGRRRPSTCAGMRHRPARRRPRSRRPGWRSTSTSRRSTRSSAANSRCSTRPTIPADVLSGLPLRSLTFDMTPDCIVRAVGVTYCP